MNNTAWLPRAMPYKKWKLILQALPRMLGLDTQETPQVWRTYTFRRLLPTIADIIGLHPGHRQALGEWVEQVAGVNKDAARAQPLLCHRYADNRVTTAGERKLLVAAAIPFMAKSQPQAKSWEDLRAAKITVPILDKYITEDGHKKEVLSQGKQAEVTGDSEGDEEGSSNSEESDSSMQSTDACEAAAGQTQLSDLLEWFVQPGRGSRAHIQRVINDGGRRVPFCRDSKPFWRFPESTGDSLSAAAAWHGGVCDQCLARMPQQKTSTILAAIFSAADAAK